MLNFVLVGCGRIAERHAHLLGSQQIDNGRLIAVCDTNIDNAKKLGEQYQVPYFTEMHTMMQELNNSIDVVVVLTPSGLHSEHVVELSHYKKHIIVEKPMALTLEQADAMINACSQNNIRLFVVKQNRFNLPVLRLREAIEANKFGNIFLGTVRVRWCRTQEYYDLASWRGTWDLDRGVFANQASHHIDLLQWMLGEVTSVFAKGRTALVDIEAEDTGVSLISFKSGALGVVEATTATRPVNLEGSISILGEHGTVEIGGFAVNQMKIWEFVGEKINAKAELTKLSTNPPDVYGFGHKSYYEHVIDCLMNDTPSMLDGAEGRKTVELLSMIYDSMLSDKEVYSKSIQDQKQDTLVEECV